MFEITVKRRFAAEHSVKLPSGELEKSHVHNWLCEVYLYSQELDDCGCVIDFQIVDTALGKVLDTLENKKVHELKIFDGQNSSSELIAKYIFEKLSSRLGKASGMLSKVTVWEDNNHGASYRNATHSG